MVLFRTTDNHKILLIKLFFAEQTEVSGSQGLDWLMFQRCGLDWLMFHGGMISARSERGRKYSVQIALCSDCLPDLL